MAKVSVVIPVYNVERYLEECLDSVANQSLKDLEIICVDDGSSDHSGKILDDYAKRDSRFHVIHKKNEGYGKAINVGMAMAASPYVGIVESDDRIAEVMYEELYGIAETWNAEVIKADHYEFYKSQNGSCIEEYIPLTREEALLSLYEKVLNVSEQENALKFSKYTWSGIYRSDFLRREHILHNETPGASYQDNGFWFQTMVKAESVYFVKKAYYHYRIDNPNSSVVSTTKVLAVNQEYDFIDKILEQMGTKGLRFRKWSRYFRLWGNVGVISQIAPEYKEELAAVTRQELIKGMELGEIEADLYDGYLKERLFDILADVKKFVGKDKARREKIEGATKGYSTLILYGAGQIGRQVQGLLKEGRVNTKIGYFAVTKEPETLEELCGIPIRGLAELAQIQLQENALVIISAGKKYEEEMRENLNQMGFHHAIYYKELML